MTVPACCIGVLLGDGYIGYRYLGSDAVEKDHELQHMNSGVQSTHKS